MSEAWNVDERRYKRKVSMWDNQVNEESTKVSESSSDIKDDMTACVCGATCEAKSTIATRIEIPSRPMDLCQDRLVG